MCERNLLAHDFGYDASGYAMLRLFERLLAENEDGFTAAECGILGCLVVIFAEMLVLKF